MRAFTAVALVCAFLAVAAPAWAAKVIPCKGPSDVETCKKIGGCYPNECVKRGTGFVCKTQTLNTPCQPRLFPGSPDGGRIDVCTASLCIAPDTKNGLVACRNVPRPKCEYCGASNPSRPNCPQIKCRTVKCTKPNPLVAGQRCDYSELQAGCCPANLCASTAKNQCFPKACIWDSGVDPDPTENFPQGKCTQLGPRPVPAGEKCCVTPEECVDPAKVDYCITPTCLKPAGAKPKSAGLCLKRPTYPTFEKTCCSGVYHCVPFAPVSGEPNPNCKRRVCVDKAGNDVAGTGKSGFCRYLMDKPDIIPNCRTCIPGSLVPGERCTERGACKKPACKGPLDPVRPYTCTVLPDLTLNGQQDLCPRGEICCDGDCKKSC